MTKEEMKETLKEVQKKVLLSYDEEKIKEFFWENTMKKILDILFKKKKKGVTKGIRIIENGREKWIRTNRRF